MADLLQSATHAPASLRNFVVSLNDDELNQWIAELDDDEAEAVLYDWYGLWAREKQIPPDWQWTIWLILAGRGFGKTRTGAEFIRDGVENHNIKRIALVGATAADVRDVMVLGESGLLAVCPSSNMPQYIASRRAVIWPNGATAWMYSAEKPRQLRGPQHERAWLDELAAWQYLDATLDMLLFGLRLGTQPQCIITTTPKPLKRIIRLINQSKNAQSATKVALTVGSTFENELNLAPTFVENVKAEYEGTNLGRQELYAEIVEDNEHALWKRETIDDTRIAYDQKVPDFDEVVVSIDHAVSTSDSANDTALVVVARADNHVYVLACKVLHCDPLEWANVAIGLFQRYKADWIIVEPNNGGDLVTSNLHTVDADIPIKEIRATRGKVIRAAPVANIYLQQRAHHVGTFGDLEDVMCNWQPGQKSPDPLDALVAAVTHLLDLNTTRKIPLHDEPIVEDAKTIPTVVEIMRSDPFKWASDHLGSDW